MQAFDTWEAYREFIKGGRSEYDPSVSISGFFDTLINKHDKVTGTATQVEDIVRENFSNGVEVIAAQSPTFPDPENERIVYGAEIYLLADYVPIGQVVIHAGFCRVSGPSGSNLFPAYLEFNTDLPLGEYQKQTLEAIRRMWPLVSTLERGKPKGTVETGPDEKKLCAGINLVEGREATAVGYRVFEKLGLGVDRKQTSTIAGYID